MATISGTVKYTLKYVSTESGESVARSISGLNVKSGQDTATGPYDGTAISNFYSYIINAFSTGTVNGLRWIRESEVVL